MFKNAKAGDKAWSIQAGWGTICYISKGRPYPIEFKSDVNNKEYFFTYNGMYKEIDTNPTLFWNEFKIPKEAFIKPLPDLKIDTKVIVWNEENKKFKRHFSHFKDGIIYCFNDGRSLWNAIDNSEYWNNWELVNE